MPHTDLVADVFAAFAQDAQAFPAMTLRSGDALDGGREAIPHDVVADAVSDEYLETYPWGLGWLDAGSWRHYLPFLMEFALRNVSRPGDAVDALLTTFRPPDRTPPRLGSLSKAQETAVLRVLDVLAHEPGSAHLDLASQVLAEWWTPGAIPREIDD